MFDRLLITSIVPCSFGAWLKELDDDSRKNIETALAVPKSSASYKSNSTIVAFVLDEAERKFDAETVGAHRNGRCRCSRS